MAYFLLILILIFIFEIHASYSVVGYQRTISQEKFPSGRNMLKGDFGLMREILADPLRA
jgi:hypothetical protein